MRGEGGPWVPTPRPNTQPTSLRTAGQTRGRSDFGKPTSSSHQRDLEAISSIIRRGDNSSGLNRAAVTACVKAFGRVSSPLDPEVLPPEPGDLVHHRGRFAHQ